MALVEMTKDDDYSQLLNPDTVLCFDLKDSTIKSLEKFDEAGYTDSISTDRLFLTKENNPDFAWLTWFWVWFPFWLPLAIDLALLIIIVPICFILALKDADY